MPRPRPVTMRPPSGTFAQPSRREPRWRIGKGPRGRRLPSVEPLSTKYRTADAIALLVPAVESFADLADDPAVIGLKGQLARAYFLSDDNRRAIEVADRVLEAAEHADLAAIVADTLITKGTALGILGRSTEGLGVLGAGASLAEAHEPERHPDPSVHQPARSTSRSVTRGPRSNTHGPAWPSRGDSARPVRPRSSLATASRPRSGRVTGPGLSRSSSPPSAIDSRRPIGSRCWRAAISYRRPPRRVDRGPSRRARRLVGSSVESRIQAANLWREAMVHFAAGRLAEARTVWHDLAEASVGNLPESQSPQRPRRSLAG